MDVYIYQAALLCADCGVGQRQHLDQAFLENGVDPVNVNDESSFDSERYPKGPYSDGGGEADCPQHCDHCGVFLENPLTPDGEQYVADAFCVFIERGAGALDVLRTWRAHYDYAWSICEDLLDADNLPDPEASRYMALEVWR